MASTSQDIAIRVVSGGIAATISACVTAPIDRVKILLQVQAASTQITPGQHYKGIIDTFLRIPREQGFTSFWRGNFPQILGSFIPTSVIYFAAFEGLKSTLLTGLDRERDYNTYVAGSAIAGGLAGLTGLTLVYPFSFARVRIGADVGVGQTRLFTGMNHCWSTVLKTDGVRGLYRGFLTAVQGIVVYRAAYFGLYDAIVGKLSNRKDMPVYWKWVIAQNVVLFSGVISYPFDTVRSRMMLQSGLSMEDRLYRSTTNCWRKIFAMEGIRGFYGGLLCSLLKGTGAGVMLVAYEEIKRRTSSP